MLKKIVKNFSVFAIIIVLVMSFAGTVSAGAIEDAAKSSKDIKNDLAGKYTVTIAGKEQVLGLLFNEKGEPVLNEAGIQLLGLSGKPVKGDTGEFLTVKDGKAVVETKAEDKKEEPKKEEQKTEEPKAEGPKTEEPKAEEPKTEEPKAEEPKTEEPKTEEPKTEEPKTEEPKTEEPKTEEPKTEEPKTEEPKTEEPKTEEPKTEEPKADGQNAEGSGTKADPSVDVVVTDTNTDDADLQEQVGENTETPVPEAEGTEEEIIEVPALTILSGEHQILLSNSLILETAEVAEEGEETVPEEGIEEVAAAEEVPLEEMAIEVAAILDEQKGDYSPGSTELVGNITDTSKKSSSTSSSSSSQTKQTSQSSGNKSKNDSSKSSSSSSSSTKTVKAQGVKTGDYSNILLYVILIIVAVVVIILLVVLSRRRRNNAASEGTEDTEDTNRE